MRATLTALTAAGALIGFAPAQAQSVDGAYPPPASETPGGYQSADSTYQQQLRDYQRQRSEYELQRRAYEEQFTPRAYAAPPVVRYEVEPRREAWRGYYRYAETMAYRDGPWVEGDHSGRWYRDHGCRLASPERDADHVVPVCPDSMGRFRAAD